MLTQSTPSIIAALQKVMPPAALKQLTQALGNCGQPLTHRGPVNLQPSLPPQAGGRGVYGGAGADGNPSNTWNTQYYSPLISYNEQAFYDIPGFGPGGTTTNNYYGDNFSFPTTNVYNITNNYSNTIGGGTFIPGIVTDQPIRTIPGLDGLDGRDGFDGFDGLGGFDGRDGRDGAAGAAGEAGVAGEAGGRGPEGPAGPKGVKGDRGEAGANGVSVVGPQGPAGETGPQGPQGPSGAQGPEGPQGPQGPQGIPGDGCANSVSITYMKSQGILDPTVSPITFATNGIKTVSLSGITVTLSTAVISVPTGVTFDAESCSVSLTGNASYEVVTGVTAKASLTTTPADKTTVNVVTDVNLPPGDTGTTTVCTP